MAVMSAPQAMPPQHLWDPKQTLHTSRWRYKKEDAHVGSFFTFVGYFPTIFSYFYSYCEFPLLLYFLF